MNYKLESLINRPRSEVWEAFEDPERMKSWQPSLTGIELLSGVQREPGSVSKWTFSENGREFSLNEKVLRREAPARFESLLENQFASNVVHHLFVEQGENQTLWTMETQYKFKTVLMRILGPILKKNYMARSRQEMDRFKEMVEGR